jgi:uncharacterized membrane protein
MQRSLIVIVIASLVGFADSLYLTLDHYISLPLPCSITHGCETVLHSVYSMVGPIPLAAFGIIFYLFVGFLALFILTSPQPSRKMLLLLVAASAIGAIMSIGFELLQYFVIHAICMYCALQAGCSFAILALALPFYDKK